MKEQNLYRISGIVNKKQCKLNIMTFPINKITDKVITYQDNYTAGVTDGKILEGSIKTEVLNEMQFTGLTYSGDLHSLYIYCLQEDIYKNIQKLRKRFMKELWKSLGDNFKSIWNILRTIWTVTTEPTVKDK
jgi:hypothetical protein